MSRATYICYQTKCEVCGRELEEDDPYDGFCSPSCHFAGGDQ